MSACIVNKDTTVVCYFLTSLNKKIDIFQNKVAKLKMTKTLVVLCTFFGTVQVVIGFGVFDSSNYKVLDDPIVGNFSYHTEKCTGELNCKTKCS